MLRQVQPLCTKMASKEITATNSSEKTVQARGLRDRQRIKTASLTGVDGYASSSEFNVPPAIA